MECCVRRADGVFRIAASRLSHPVKGSNAVSRFEFDNVRPHGVYNARNVISLVNTGLARLGALPVLGIGPGNHDFGNHLIIVWVWNGRVDNFDLRARMDDGFLHCAVDVEESWF